MLFVDDCEYEVKLLVEIVVSLVKFIYENGGFRDEVVVLLSCFFYGEFGYFFGYDNNGICVFNGSNLVGIGNSYWDLKDSNGIYFICELVKVGKLNKFVEGGNYVIYYFLKFGDIKFYFKLLYFVYFFNWDLMIGIGFYIDEVEWYFVGIEEDVYFI